MKRRRLSPPAHPSRLPVLAAIVVGFLTIFVAWAARQATQDPPIGDVETRLWHHRNLGKAFYENPATQDLAVTEFREALGLRNSPVERTNHGLALIRAGRLEEGLRELRRAQEADPSIPHTWFNLGIAAKRMGDLDQARSQLAGFVERVPGDAPAHYNLGAIYRILKDPDQALKHFEEAARIAPHMAAPHFQLAQLYRARGETDKAQREQTVFRQIKRVQAEEPVAEDPEWSPYAEIVDVPQPRLGDDEASIDYRFEARTLDPDFKPQGLTPLATGDGGPPSILAWDDTTVRHFTPQGVERLDASFEAVEGLSDVVPGDFNDDGRTDVALLTRQGVRLWAAQESGGFLRSFGALAPKSARAGVFLDFDHDSDADLLILGESLTLWRNEGPSGFRDQSAELPVTPGRLLDATVVDLVKDANTVDVVVTFEDRPALLMRDRFRGRFETVPLPQLQAGAHSLLAADLDSDGWTDLIGLEAGRLVVLLNRQGRFVRQEMPDRLAGRPALGDFANRGRQDLAIGSVILSHRRDRLLGERREWAGDDGPLIASDFDQDGRLDLLSGGERGLVLHRNRTPDVGRWLRVSLEGVRSPRSGELAEVEVKAGSSYQKRTFRGAPLHFGLGERRQAEVVRVTWPNGLIQNEIRVSGGQAHHYREKQRLSGSCPTVFVWNGRGFEFLGDVLGAAPLGAPLKESGLQVIDHDEYIQLPASMLVPRDGQFEIRVTEELREVAYLDQIELVAIDHDRDLTLLHGDRFTDPPVKRLTLYGVDEKRRPISAVDSDGRDVREVLLRRDRRYPDGFERDLRGRAQEHYLELDFGESESDQALLVLNGWIDWPEAAAFVQAQQESGGDLKRPWIEAMDAEGRWVTIVEDMGIPAGKPRTIAIDLSGRFPTRQRRLRIVTNLCLYWDEIYLSPRVRGPASRLTRLQPSLAELRFHGFSRPILDPTRRQPELFIYSETIPLPPWNPTPGLYTRYGDVTHLIRGVDDRLVVMGAGDELRLRFDPTTLPPLAEGRERSYLLYFNGWVKDGDLNTASHDSVAPLPYRSMPRYPYDPAEGPGDGMNDRGRFRDQTRPGLRLFRNLVPEPAPARPPKVSRPQG